MLSTSVLALLASFACTLSSMKAFRVITITAAAGALATAGVASAATKPIVSKEQTATVTKAPVAIGTLKKGAKLPSRDKLVFRTVTLSKGQKATVTMTAPKGKTLSAVAHTGKITDKVVSPKKFAGKRSVKLTVTTTSKRRVTGRIYALAR
jgi:hypothetical protein